MKLKNKIAIVTGAAKGIGRGIALGFAKEGANVVIVDVLISAAEKVGKEIGSLGRDYLVIKTDVSNSKEVEGMSAAVINKFKRIDILVNNAGISRAGAVVDVKDEDWDAIMNVNLKGVFLCSRAVGRQMIKQKSGKIINMASIAAKTGEIYNAPYCATKAGVLSITQAQALELAPYKINVNAICPGATDTELMERIFNERGPIGGLTPEECRKKFEDAIPLGRMGTPEDIAKLAVFLASDDSDYITGQAININGGSEFH